MPVAAIGPESATSRFEVFLDFSGETSGRLAVVLDALRHRHENDVRIVFRQLPAENDPAGELRHRAALAAARQDRFWPMARLILANQNRGSRDDLLGMAAQLQLDVARFAADLDDAAAADTIRADRSRARDAGITSAPAILHDDTPLAGDRTLANFERLTGPPR
jgi:predicted DsbA family dithiol-disulfide isomerase